MEKKGTHFASSSFRDSFLKWGHFSLSSELFYQILLSLFFKLIPLMGFVGSFLWMQGLESHVVKSLGKGASTIVAENSAREVPTGPDPLHHNNNPTRPWAL